MYSGRAAAIDRLKHMLEATVAIADYVARGRETFDEDSAIRDAILYRIIVLGEAAKRALDADPSLEEELSEVEWSPIARMRDRVTHHYWRTDNNIVWATAAKSAPELRAALESALTHLS